MSKNRIYIYIYISGARTRQGKQDEPINDQNGPEHRNVEDGEPGARKADGNRPRGRVPELELGQPSDERSELLVLLGRQSASLAVFHLVVHNLI